MTVSDRVILSGMADNKLDSASPKGDEGLSPTSLPSTPAIQKPTSGAANGLSADFLAELGLELAGGVKPSGAATQPEPEKEAEPAPAKADPTPEELEKAAIEQAEADAVKEEKGEDDDTVPSEAELKKVPDWVPERLKKNSEQKKALREEIAKAKAEKEAAEKALADAAATIKAPLPPSPLAQFDTEESLQKENDAVLAFLDFAEKPEAIESYKDFDPETGKSTQFENDKAYAKFFLKNQKAHLQTLKERLEIAASVRKNVPELFDGKSEKAKERAALYQSDPRTRADYDQLIADAQLGRQYRKEIEAGKKVHILDIPKLLAKARNGNGNGKKDAEKFTPATPPATRAPATPTDGRAADLLQEAMRTQKAVSVDDLAASWANQ